MTAEEDALHSVNSVFRPIHYLGSKLRMLPSIVAAVDRADPGRGRVCDLFAGSGTVSAALSIKREVTAADIQEYSRVLCSALLKPISVLDNPLNGANQEEDESLSYAAQPVVDYEDECIRDAQRGDLGPLADFLEHCSLVALQASPSFTGSDRLRSALELTVARLTDVGLAGAPESLTVRLFGGVYFSFRQAVQLDTLLTAIFSGPPAHRHVLLAAALSTASEVVNTIGKHFAQPIRPRNRRGRIKPWLLSRVTRDRAIDVFQAFDSWLHRYKAIKRDGHRHSIRVGDYRQVLDGLDDDVSVVYADPPYTRDHYSRYYHVLETLCRRDEPEVSRVRIGGREQTSRGVYRVDRHQSPFCIPSQAAEAFSELFERVAALRVPLVLSYSPYPEANGARPRLLTLRELTSLARATFRFVEAEGLGITHSKLNASRLNYDPVANAEVLMVCRP